ncbi:MAG: AAA family ATPase [Candidatus Glassbacteria bacterium]|nr:AAA family ATPase [Candidatus Glassbacteria bacterium]
MLIGLTSRNAAGKDEVARYLVERKGFSYFSLSDVLRRELERRSLPVTRENLVETGNALRLRHGPGALAELALEALGDTEDAVVVSIRNPGEVEVLRRRGDFILVGVDAPLELRYRRARARGRPEDPHSLEEFTAQERAELAGAAGQQQLDACFALSDRVLVNDGTLEELHRKVEELP